MLGRGRWVRLFAYSVPWSAWCRDWCAQVRQRPFEYRL